MENNKHFSRIAYSAESLIEILYRYKSCDNNENAYICKGIEVTTAWFIQLKDEYQLIQNDIGARKSIFDVLPDSDEIINNYPGFFQDQLLISIINKKYSALLAACKDTISNFIDLLSAKRRAVKICKEKNESGLFSVQLHSLLSEELEEQKSKLDILSDQLLATYNDYSTALTSIIGEHNNANVENRNINNVSPAFVEASMVEEGSSGQPQIATYNFNNMKMQQATGSQPYQDVPIDSSYISNSNAAIPVGVGTTEIETPTKRKIKRIIAVLVCIAVVVAVIVSIVLLKTDRTQDIPLTTIDNEIQLSGDDTGKFHFVDLSYSLDYSWDLIENNAPATALFDKSLTYYNRIFENWGITFGYSKDANLSTFPDALELYDLTVAENLRNMSNISVTGQQHSNYYLDEINQAVMFEYTLTLENPNSITVSAAYIGIIIVTKNGYYNITGMELMQESNNIVDPQFANYINAMFDSIEYIE